MFCIVDLKTYTHGTGSKPSSNLQWTARGSGTSRHTARTHHKWHHCRDPEHTHRTDKNRIGVLDPQNQSTV